MKNQYETFQLETYVKDSKCPKNAEKKGRGCKFTLYPGVFNKELFKYVSALKKPAGDEFTEKHIPGLLKYRDEIYDVIYHNSGLSLREAVRKQKTPGEHETAAFAGMYQQSVMTGFYHQKFLAEARLIRAYIDVLKL